MKTWRFVISLCGIGNTPEEAWQDAIENFTDDPDACPEGDDAIIVDDEKCQECLRYGTELCEGDVENLSCLEASDLCEKCQKLGENTCGNDTENHSCFEA